MNDKQQLEAMGAQYRLTEEQAKALAERIPQSGVFQILDDEPLCMAKRIEELEAQVRGLVGLLREVKPYVKDCADWGRKHDADLRDHIDADLSGNLPAPAMPEGWKLVPVEPTHDMLYVIISCGHFDVVQPEMAGKYYRAMLAASPSPDDTK